MVANSVSWGPTREVTVLHTKKFVLWPLAKIRRSLLEHLVSNAWIRLSEQCFTAVHHDGKGKMRDLYSLFLVLMVIFSVPYSNQSGHRSGDSGAPRYLKSCASWSCTPFVKLLCNNVHHDFSLVYTDFILYILNLV